MGLDKRILYPDPDVGVAVIAGSPEWFSNPLNTIEELAKKDVPAGMPYKIVDVSVVAIDRTFRNDWEYDFSNPDGYGLGHIAWLEQRNSK